MDNKEKMALFRLSNHCIARFVRRSRIERTSERIEEHFTRLLETDAMLLDIGGRFVDVPDKLQAAKAVKYIHLFRIYVV